MSVLVEYVVERNGVGKMTFPSKAEADAYDKLLDTVDGISQVLSKSQVLKEEEKIEELAMYLAKNRDSLITALAQKRKSIANSVDEKSQKPKSKKQSSLASQSLLDIVIEPDEDAIIETIDETLDQSKDNVAAA